MCEQCNFEPMLLEEILTTPLNYKCPSIPDTLEDEKKQLMECETSIKLSIKQTETKFLTLGENLAFIRDKKLYKHSCYVTFDLYIQNTFNMSKSTAYRLIQISEFMKSCTGATFEKYNYSQLIEIVSIPEEDRKNLLLKITSQMSKREIQQLKHYYYKNKQKEAESNLKSDFAENQINRPSFEEAYEEALKTVENDEIKPLMLKNDKQRKEFLETYEQWELMAIIPYLNLKIYRRRLKNQSSIIAFSAEITSSKHSYVRYSIYIEPENKNNYGYQYVQGYFNIYFHSENEVIDFLKKQKDEIS